MKLTSEAVDAIMRKALCAKGEDCIKVAGLVRNFQFHQQRLQEAKSEIDALLHELPDQFQSRSGGGWSFLNMVHDRHGEQWTGLHQTMEALACLGIGAGSAKWLMREMADVMPGGVPYFVVTEARPAPIDTSEIKEADEAFFEKTRLVRPKPEPAGD